MKYFQKFTLIFINDILEQNEDIVDDDKISNKRNMEKSIETKITNNEAPKNVLAASLAANINPQVHVYNS